MRSSRDELLSDDDQQAAGQVLNDANLLRHMIAGFVEAQGGTVFVTNEQTGRGALLTLHIDISSGEGVTLSIGRKGRGPA